MLFRQKGWKNTNKATKQVKFKWKFWLFLGSLPGRHSFLEYEGKTASVWLWHEAAVNENMLGYSVIYSVSAESKLSFLTTNHQSNLTCCEAIAQCLRKPYWKRPNRFWKKVSDWSKNVLWDLWVIFLWLSPKSRGLSRIVDFYRGAVFIPYFLYIKKLFLGYLKIDFFI